MCVCVAILKIKICKIIKKHIHNKKNRVNMFNAIIWYILLPILFFLIIFNFEHFFKYLSMKRNISNNSIFKKDWGKKKEHANLKNANKNCKFI